MRRAVVLATAALIGLDGLGRAAEEAGFDRLWTTEYVGRDAVARALALALATRRIRVGTGVAYAFTRPPLAMAALGSDVMRLSGGRFDLGLSPGSRGVRRWFDASFEPPTASLVHYLERLRELWTDDQYASPALFAPALNERFTERLAITADGLLAHPLALGAAHAEQRLVPAAVRGAAERDGRPLELVAWQIVSISDDDATARLRAAAQLAFYFSTPSYARVLEGTSWTDVPGLVGEAFSRASRPTPWLDLARLIPDALVDELSIAGTPAAVRAGLTVAERRLADLGFSEMALQTVGAGLSDDETLRHLHLIVRETGPRASTGAPHDRGAP